MDRATNDVDVIFETRKKDFSQPSPPRRSELSSSTEYGSDEAQFQHKEDLTPPRGHSPHPADMQKAGQNHPEWSPSLDHSQTYQEHGAPIDDRNNDSGIINRDYEAHKHLWWYRVRHIMRPAFAEFLGTMILIVFGDGSVAQVQLSANESLPQGSQNKGDYQSISWGWGIGVLFGVYVAGCAGGHINPAVTLANCIFRGFPWWKLPIYAIAQTTGAFCGAAIIYGNYRSAIDAYEGYGVRTVPGYSDTSTAGVFCTYPQPFMTKTGMVFSEIIASAVLMLVIFAIKDDANLGAGNLVPLMLFFLIFGIGATLGWETGYAINLARDFGPRLFTYFIGYGNEVWSAGNYYFWVPMVCPFIGTVFGGFIYDTLIYTGRSPINTEWMGLKILVKPDREKLKKAILEGDKERAG